MILSFTKSYTLTFLSLKFPGHPCDTAMKNGCEDICLKRGDKAMCACKKPFKLAKDELSCIKINPCDEIKCRTNEVCVMKGDHAKCRCKNGYELSEDGITCEEVHPCKINNGGCTHQCEKVGSTAVCKCRKDYLLEEDGKSCERGIVFLFSFFTRWAKVQMFLMCTSL